MLKERLTEKLMAQSFVTLVDFPDGNTLNIPSIGQFVAQKDYVDGNEIEFQSPDLGNFTFSITESDAVGFAITDRQKEDIHYATEALSKYIAEANRALEEQVETEIMKIINDGQTASDLNTINGAAHRFVAADASDVIKTVDLRRAKYALKKANVPLTNLVAIVDPSVEESLRTDTDIQAAIQNTPRWADLIESGFSNDLNFLGSYEGIDIYTSNFLPVIGAETVDGDTVANGVANYVFSADASVEALMFGWRRMPSMAFSRNETKKVDEYTGSQRYGTGLYREGAVVTILSDSTAPF
jgi:hypothetical protein